MAAVPRSGTPEKSAAPSRPVRERPPAVPAVVRRRLLATVAATAGVVLLFVAYLQVSRTYAVNSDSANIMLMSWDMLHGNVLLHGWYLSDVSFYPTELPQYAMLEGLLGLHADTAHIAAAMTYTLAVIFAVLLARGPRGRAPGRAAWPRMALTGGLMIAPQLGVGAFVLLLSVGHIGTAVPLMLTWLVIDAAAARPCLPGGPTVLSPSGEAPPPRTPLANPPARAWFVPVIVGLLLTWVLVADPLVLVVGIVPLVAVCGMRVLRAVLSARPPDRGAALQASWYEVSLAAAAILAYGLADLVNRLLSASGGFILHPLGYQLAPLHTWPKHAWVTGEGLLALFGRVFGLSYVLGRALSVVSLVGIAVVATASPALNESIYREAQRRGVLCNVVDVPEYCDFYYPAVVRRGDLQIAISTSGQSPSLAQRLRQQLERQFGPAYAPWVAELGATRKLVLASDLDSQRKRELLHSLASREAFEAASAEQSTKRFSKNDRRVTA